ncbi:hypothetical protein [Candidatus Clostridium radicumherbarum]|uniref:Uncharacterized protein n=1 Tax=Candidatus Clostridium radicumherbarum TaxID=3381662 RepID=A0ABW8U2W9_9CLOT
MGRLFEPIGLYVYAIIFIIYSVILWFLPPLTKTKKQRFKVIFFAFWSLLFAAYYNIMKVPTLNYATNKYGIPQQQWIFIINFIGFMIMGIIVYTFFVSSRGIKSLKKDGIDLSDEEDEIIVKTQTGVVEDYQEIIKAEYNTIRYIPIYCLNIENDLIHSIQDSTFDIDSELTKIVEMYLNNKINSNENLSQISIIEANDLNNIKKDFKLNFLEFKKLEKKLKEKEGYINNSKDTKILIFPYLSLVSMNDNENNGNDNENNGSNNAIKYIVLSNNTEKLLTMEQWAISNVLRAFEGFLSKTILEIISTLDLEHLTDDAAIDND